MSGSYVCYSYWSIERFGKAEPCIERTHEIIRFLHLQTTDLELRLTQDVDSLFGPVFKATQRHKMFWWWFVNVIITDRMNNDENEKAVKPPTNKSCRVLLDLEVEMIHFHRFTRFTLSQILRFPCHVHHLSCNLRPLHSSDGHLAKWECRELPQQWPLNIIEQGKWWYTDKLWDFGWFWGLLYQPHVPEASAFTFSHGPYLSRNGCSLAHITHISTSHHGCRPCDPRTGSRRSFVDRRSHPKHTCRCLRLLIHVPSSPINLCHCSESLGRIYGTCTLPASILRWLDLDLEIYTCIYIHIYT